MIVAVDGVLDLHTSPRLRDHLDQMIAQKAPHLVIDLSGVEFCDSSGLGVLIFNLKRARAAGGSLGLAAPRGSVRRLLHTTGLDRVMAVHRSVEEALDKPVFAEDDASAS